MLWPSAREPVGPKETPKPKSTRGVREEGKLIGIHDRLLNKGDPVPCAQELVPPQNILTSL